MSTSRRGWLSALVLLMVAGLASTGVTQEPADSPPIPPVAEAPQDPEAQDEPAMAEAAPAGAEAEGASEPNQEPQEPSADPPPAESAEGDNAQDAEPKPDEPKPAEADAADAAQEPAEGTPPPRRSTESFLPNTTRAWVSIVDPKQLNDAFARTQLGQLASDEALKPFVDDVGQQIRDWLDDDNLRHGIRLSKLEPLDTGEICVAGILPQDVDGAIKRERHGLVLIVDVSRCRDEAAELLEKTGVDLTDAGATSAVEEINGVPATKWTFPKPQGLRRQRIAYQAIAGDWLVASDNGEIFRQVVRWIMVPDLLREETLAEDPVFQELTRRAAFDDASLVAHVRWYIDPFGYLDLARVIAEEDQDPTTKQRSNNFARIVKNSGFDAIKGVAGSLTFATAEHEIVHRTFVYAPPVAEAGENRYEKSAAILDFVNREHLDLEPEPWVPLEAASYVTFTWNLDKVINHLNYVVDAVTDEGSYENMLKNIKESNNVDVRKLVGCLNSRVSIVTEVVDPIDVDSEKIVVGIGILKEAEFVEEQVKNFFGDSLKTETEGDVTIYFEQTEVEDEADLLFGDLDEPGMQEEDEAEGDLMAEKFVAVHHGYVLIANDLTYLKRIISQTGEPIGSQDDFIRVREALGKMVHSDRISLRHFGRLDRVFKANYELMRANKLQSARTVFSKLLGQLEKRSQEQGHPPREFDGSKMPPFETAVAPRLGPSGWIIESEDDGWRITSCLLARPEAAIPAATAESQDDAPSVTRDNLR